MYLKGQDPQRLEMRNYFDQVISQYQIPDHKRIMNITASGEDPHNYYSALCRYYFAPSRVLHAVPETADFQDQFDYILVLTKNEEARRFVTESIQSDQVIVVMK